MGDCDRTARISIHRFSVQCERCRGWALYDQLDRELRCLQCGRLITASRPNGATGTPPQAA